MRVVYYVILSLFSYVACAQSYVDSGIQKYQVGEFQEAIEFFDKGYELRDVLPSASVARIFLYRGMSKFELLKENG